MSNTNNKNDLMQCYENQKQVQITKYRILLSSASHCCLIVRPAHTLLLGITHCMLTAPVHLSTSTAVTLYNCVAHWQPRGAATPKTQSTW